MARLPKRIRYYLIRALRALDIAGGLAIRTRTGAVLVGLLFPRSRPLICTNCLEDHGLRLNAELVAIPHALPCPHCGCRGTKKLTRDLILELASQFFIRGSHQRCQYGSIPMVMFNELQYQMGDYKGTQLLKNDVALLSEKARIGFFHAAPNAWMWGEVEPLKELQNPSTRQSVIQRIFKEYSERTLPKGTILYRLRKDPVNPSDKFEYDSPPSKHLGCGRLDSMDQPVFYCSDDIDTCVHECRVTVEDNLYLATLRPTMDLRLLDLTEILSEEKTTSFESLDMAIHMLFFAAEHSYEISRGIAIAANKAGFDGLLYPSYFSQIKAWQMPMENIYGISIRRIPEFQGHVKSGIFSNIALFGRPVERNILEIVSINRLVIHTVSYDFRFGPTPP